MNQLLIRKDKLVFNGEVFEINDLFTNELYRYSDDNAQKYSSNIPVVNEIYLNRVQPVMALMLYIRENQIDIVKIEEIDEFLYPIVVDTARICDLKVIGIRKYINFKKVIIGHLYIIFSTLFLLWKMILISYSAKFTRETEKFSIIRTPAAKKKMEHLESIDIKFECFNSEKTIYKYFSRRERMLWVIKSWLISYSELKNYIGLVNEEVGLESATDAFKYYSKRVVHTLLYQQVVDRYFSKNIGKTYYTGNNLDRFAIIEEKYAKKHNIKTVCIPHGLEYGFKLPYCFTGDTFYTTSKQAEKHLNLLYNTNKFIYDEIIALKMFRVSQNNNPKKGLVFFTEPREVNVNLKIIDVILPLIEQEKIKLNIKLHPKDRKNNYVIYGDRVNFIEDMNDALRSNICFARKSTTLLEAVYNGSNAGAILINEKDVALFNTFPSLQDDKIDVFYNTLDLFNWIKTIYK